jgi:hypothetical protein
LPAKTLPARVAPAISASASRKRDFGKLKGSLPGSTFWHAGRLMSLRTSAKAA